MKRVLIFIINIVFFYTVSFGQPTHRAPWAGPGLRGPADGQNEEKVKKPDFCGYKYKDTSRLRMHFEQQLAFLQINSGDTIVDIGSSSGTYIGCINVIADFKNTHFILVDIDSNCLNATKVNNMIAHYEGLRGQPFNNSIGFVKNTTDSLWLPLNRYKKMWIFNTLHEIPGKSNIIKQIAAVLQSGGELIIAELLATEKRKIHQGCKMPLMTDDEIKKLMSDEGFEFKNVAVNPLAVKKMKNPYCLYRFVKK
jgi:ubiquinone/menaquinone biosynthesis C-methylase UbiE